MENEKGPSARALIASWRKQSGLLRVNGHHIDFGRAEGLTQAADELEAAMAEPAAPPALDAWKQVDEVLNFDTMGPYFSHGDKHQLTAFLTRARKLVRGALGLEDAAPPQGERLGTIRCPRCGQWFTSIAERQRHMDAQHLATKA